MSENSSDTVPVGEVVTPQLNRHPARRVTQNRDRKADPPPVPREASRGRRLLPPAVPRHLAVHPAGLVSPRSTQPEGSDQPPQLRQLLRTLLLSGRSALGRRLPDLGTHIPGVCRVGVPGLTPTKKLGSSQG